MRRTNVMSVIFVVSLLFLVGCDGIGVEGKAEKILEEAQREFDDGEYVKALASIDSLRTTYPKAIEMRKTALKLYQQIELRRAQSAVQAADKALQRANTDYEAMRSRIDSLKETGKMTLEQLRLFNYTKARRDSLQNVFDVECAKIKYIKVKMAE
ncbi:MAG: hypothetical protein LUC88_03935 [Prevotella sp.]|nr:hypothetical protein [Prevotella sp.]